MCRSKLDLPLRRGRRPAAAERPGGGSTVVLPIASLGEPQRSSLRWPGDRGDLFRNKCVACFGGGGPGPLQEPSGLGNPQQLRGVRGQSPCRFFPGYSCSGAQLITPGLSQSQDQGPSSPEPQPHSEGQSRAPHRSPRVFQEMTTSEPEQVLQMNTGLWHSRGRSPTSCLSPGLPRPQSQMLYQAWRALWGP